MKRSISWGVFFWLWILVLPVAAQYRLTAPVFKPLTWEQASMLAARENKLVFVDVVPAGGVQSTGKNPFADKQVVAYFNKNIIAIRIDMGMNEGKNFASKLMMTPSPVYSFFMPYGDLLYTADPAAVAKNPQLLIEAGDKALQTAVVKKSNSRSIRFEGYRFSEALAKAKNEDKLVFIYAYTNNCRPCMLIENNVFNLDKVADYYNKQFINLKIDFGKEAELTRKYGVTDYPAYLFLNGDGKQVHLATGNVAAEEFIAFGQEALKKAEGVVFTDESWEEVQARAKREDKWIFVDIYSALPPSHKTMVKTVYKDPDVAVLFNTRFINAGYDAEGREGMILTEKIGIDAFPAFCFVNPEGKVVHRFSEIPESGELIREAQRALEGNGLAYMMDEYRKGNREPVFIESYLAVLDRAKMKQETGEVALAYLSVAGPERLKERKYWDLFDAYILEVNSGISDYVYNNRIFFYSLYGKKAVNQKMSSLWLAGAMRFVTLRDGHYSFNESGFKDYVKQMKKRKVEGWRIIARKAKMDAAEKTGDWKTYVELAEERWYEEQISDAELYSWGLKINAQCHDKAIRFKAARWFALTAEEIARKQVQTGKVSLTSYKGFFDKLVDDLIRE